ncbi:unnamed protein product, partial [Amoebophrya sp. A25]|eukprot:GSA25T00017860001.1
MTTSSSLTPQQQAADPNTMKNMVAASGAGPGPASSSSPASKTGDMRSSSSFMDLVQCEL